MQYQLRDYTVRPGEFDEFLREWAELIVPLRRRLGFEVIGAWRGENRFVWVIGHEDVASANAAYYASPERAALSPDPARHLAEVRTAILESVQPPPI